jgi:aminoacrylate peracid reductase
MRSKIVDPKGAAAFLEPYSAARTIGNAIYVSGMLSVDEKGEPFGKGDIKLQTRAVLEMIKSLLEAAGASMKDITFNQIFLSDITAYPAMNEVYTEYFPVDAPARSCVRADLLKPEFLVEIAAIAHVVKKPLKGLPEKKFEQQKEIFERHLEELRGDVSSKPAGVDHSVMQPSQARKPRLSPLMKQTLRICACSPTPKRPSTSTTSSTR